MGDDGPAQIVLDELNARFSDQEVADYPTKVVDELALTGSLMQHPLCLNPQFP